MSAQEGGFFFSYLSFEYKKVRLRLRFIFIRDFDLLLSTLSGGSYNSLHPAVLVF